MVQLHWSKPRTTRVALFLLPNLPEKMEASPGVICPKKNMEKLHFLGITHFPHPPPQKKAQIWATLGFEWLVTLNQENFRRLFWSTSRNPSTCWRGKSAWKSAWRGEAKRLPSKPEPKKQSCLHQVIYVQFRVLLICELRLWKLYLSYLSKSGGLWENRPNHRVWLTGFWRIEDCQKQCSSIMWEWNRNHCNYALIFDKVSYYRRITS